MVKLRTRSDDVVMFFLLLTAIFHTMLTSSLLTEPPRQPSSRVYTQWHLGQSRQIHIQTGHLAPGIYPIAPRRCMLFVGLRLPVLHAYLSNS